MNKYLAQLHLAKDAIEFVIYHSNRTKGLFI